MPTMLAGSLKVGVVGKFVAQKLEQDEVGHNPFFENCGFDQVRLSASQPISGR
jgi:hypothetical protein